MCWATLVSAWWWRVGHELGGRRGLYGESVVGLLVRQVPPLETWIQVTGISFDPLGRVQSSHPDRVLQCLEMWSAAQKVIFDARRVSLVFAAV